MNSSIRILIILFLLFALTSSAITPVFASTISIDSFNPSADNWVAAIAVQPDGKIVVGGYFTSIAGKARSRIARLNSDGTIDNTFNPGANNIVTCFAIQADGKIIVGGSFTTLGGATRNYIGRLNADGSLDSSFNPNANGAVHSFSIQTDGKIIVGGAFTSIGGSTRNKIARLNPDGSLDNSFNPNITMTNMSQAVVYTTAVQGDGKILIGGEFTAVGGNSRSRIARVTSNGAYDNTFNPTASFSTVNNIIIQPDNKILVGEGAIKRLNENGSLDPNFTPGTTQVGSAAMSLQADGIIILGGGLSGNYVKWLNSNGTLNSSFNSGSSSYINVLEIQKDGNLLVGGNFSALNGTSRNNIGRLNNDSSISAEDITHNIASHKILWTRTGGAPEVSFVTFEFSYDSINYELLGAGTRNNNGWEVAAGDLLEGQNITIRARGYYGSANGSISITESKKDIYITPNSVDLVVTKSMDTNDGICNEDCSLREALANAGNGKTITFSPALSGQTIRLQSTLTIDKSIAIDASALSENIILSGDSDNDGDGDILILDILASQVVTIKNIEFTKGYTPNISNAGAIANLGNLSIYNSKFNSNQGGQGGAIRNSGQLLIENSSFTSNTATEGGGVFNELNKTLTITGSTFSNNSAIALPGPIGGAAGAIANIGAVNIENSTFLNNQSHTGGGAIVNSIFGNASISNSIFSGNTTFGNGGAINNFEGTMTIEGSTFTDNAAINYSGGAISNSAQLTINDSSFSENQATFGGGGAVANSSPGTISITNSSISENTSSYGAGIINEGNATITDTIITTNSATQGGGGILNGLNGNGTLSFSNGTISGNSAPYGGGAFNLSNNGSVSLANCSITGNTATDFGNGHGGGVSNFVQMTINNCTIADNSAPHYGGGIFSTGTLTVNNSTISNNSALISGGIEFYGALSLKNTIIANSLTGKDCFSSGGTLTQNTNNLIEDNAISPNQCGTPSLTSDPNLGTLANNGGTMQTMALLTNSPAINAGDNNTCEPTDQRGVARPQGVHCDIGAFEYQDLANPLITSITRVGTSPISASSVDFTVTFSESVQNVGVNDLSLTTTGVTGASITGVTPVSASVYTVSVNTGSGSGTIRLDVPNTATIKDLSNNDLSGLPFTSGETYTIDKSGGPLPTSPTFSDTPMNHPYWADIEILYANGYTAGCSTSAPLLFCPETTMNRAQSAVFMVRGNFGTSYSPPAAPWTTFGDDFSPGPWAQPWAQGMFDAGLTAGCSNSPKLFCPWEEMPRFQAAVFGMRLREGINYPPPTGTGTVFADIDGSEWYAGWVEQAYLNGLLPACGSSGGSPLFCPNDLVPRGLAAYMIVRAKNLTMP